MTTRQATILPPVALDDATVEAFRASLRGSFSAPATRTTTPPARSSMP